MIGLLQRVSRADVSVDGHRIAEINQGLIVLVGIHKHDGEAQALRLVEKLLAYRVFADAQGRMNLSLNDTGGALLLVPQFTLAADTRRGLRPGFETAAPPALAAPLFATLVSQARRLHHSVACGQFGADMQVSLTNDGPVTIWLQT